MKDKTTVMAVVNQKGGTAKTTTVENLGIGLARTGKKVLLVDVDPQASLTICLGYPKPDDLEMTLADMLSALINDQSVDISKGILHQQEGVDLIPSNIAMAGLECLKSAIFTSLCVVATQWFRRASSAGTGPPGRPSLAHILPDRESSDPSPGSPGHRRHRRYGPAAS